MAVRQRFVVPPGWPAQAPGWVPPPGWRPDLTWPAAPLGWQFWVPERSLQDAQALGVVISMPLLMLVFDVVVGGGTVVLSVWAWAFAGIALLVASGFALDRRWAGRRMQIATGFLVGCCFITLVALTSYFLFG
jgi:hypothetical protein